jgi:predicted nucleic acid-binding protein
MTVRCFVDASIFLHARDPRDPGKQARAAEWLQRLWQQRSGRTSIQALSEFHFVMTKRLKPPVPEDLAWDEVARYLAWAPQEANDAWLRRARDLARRYPLSWWDAGIVAAAQMQDCVLLLTDQLADGLVFGSLAVRDPFGPVLEEPAPCQRGESYALRPVTAEA